MEEKIVYIRRKEGIKSSLGEDTTDHIWKIGSSFKGTMPLKGLTIEEENKYLPEILGINAGSAEWGKQVRNYWKNISAIIPAGEGKKLDITTEKGVPVNIVEYILWKYCLVYSKVANSKEDLAKSPKIRFFIYSSEEEQAKKLVNFKVMKKANKLFLDLESKKDNAFAVLRIFTSERYLLEEANLPIHNIDKVSQDAKDMLLYDISINKITVNRFIEIAEDKHLLTQSFIEECIEYSTLQRVANTTTIIMDKTTIGNTMDEAIAFITDKSNSKTLLELKAKMNNMTNKNYNESKDK